MGGGRWCCSRGAGAPEELLGSLVGGACTKAVLRRWRSCGLEVGLHRTLLCMRAQQKQCLDYDVFAVRKKSIIYVQSTEPARLIRLLLLLLLLLEFGQRFRKPIKRVQLPCSRTAQQHDARIRREAAARKQPASLVPSSCNFMKGGGTDAEDLRWGLRGIVINGKGDGGGRH